MKRYYVCKIIGDGASPETAFRPAIADVVDPVTGMRAFNVAQVIKVNSLGQPVHPWCLVIAAARDHSPAHSHPDIDPLPDYNLDTKLSAMKSTTKIAAMQRIAARGVDVSALGNADGYRDLIETLGQAHAATFTADAFDVEDV